MPDSDDVKVRRHGGETIVFELTPPDDASDKEFVKHDSLLAAFLVSYLSLEKQGKGGPEAIRTCLDEAAAFATHTCGLAGSWGHGKEYE